MTETNSGKKSLTEATGTSTPSTENFEKEKSSSTINLYYTINIEGNKDSIINLAPVTESNQTFKKQKISIKAKIWLKLSAKIDKLLGVQ